MIVWLASYPRSGNTLFRIALNNLGYGPTYSVYDDPAFKELDIESLVGHEDMPAGKLEELQALPHPVFVKTHDLPKNDTFPAIYIVRDGRDAITSFAHYLIQIQGERLPHSTILERLACGQYNQIPLWSDHVRTWTERESRLEIVKYEELLRDPNGVVQRTLEKLEVSTPLSSTLKPIPTFDELRQANSKFFREGKVGTWASEIGPMLERRFWKWNRTGMQIAGYEREHKTPTVKTCLFEISMVKLAKGPANQLKRLVKATLSGLGYELRKKVLPNAVDVSDSSDPFLVQRRLMSALNKTNITIFDVGANRGETTKKYCVEFPTADIYCFEPFPESIAELQRQFSDDPRIHIVQKAVAHKKDTATFYVNERDVTNSLLPRPAHGRRYYPKSAGPKKTINVEAIDLDDFLRSNDISTIDILKMDIQGGELNALYGAEHILRTGKTSLIFTEVMFIAHYERAPLFYEVWSYLSRFGYSLFHIYDVHKATNGQIRFGDALFVSESVRNNVVDKYPEEP